MEGNPRRKYPYIVRKQIYSERSLADIGELFEFRINWLGNVLFHDMTAVVSLVMICRIS